MNITKMFSKGWELTKKNFKFFIPIVSILLVFTITNEILNRKRDYLLIEVIAQIIMHWLEIGLVIITLKIARGKKSSIKDLFRGGEYLFTYIFTSLLYYLLIIFGFILLIVPGIIWSLKYMFYPYLIVEKKMGIIESLKESGRMTDGLKWDLFKFAIKATCIYIIGILALLIGLFWAIPVCMIASVILYDEVRTVYEIKRKK